MTLDQRESTHGTFVSVRRFANRIASPAVSAGDATLGPVHDFLTGISNASSLQRDNVSLRNEVAELKSELAAVESAKSNADAIRKAAGLKSVESIPDSFANVIRL